MANTPFVVAPQLKVPDDDATPPLNVTERSSPPSSPAVDDIYLDDGSNTASGSPGWRRCVSTGPSVWEDVGALGGTSLWSRNALGAYVYPATAGDRVFIGAGTMPNDVMLEVEYTGAGSDPKTGLRVQCQNAVDSNLRTGAHVEINSSFANAGYVGVLCDFNPSTHFSLTRTFYSDVDYTGASATQTGDLYHYYGHTNHLATSSTLNRIYGLRVDYGGTGVCNYVYGLYVQSHRTGRFYGVYIEDQPNTTINAYGVYIEELKGSGGNYGIYQLGATDINYLAGNTGVGVIGSNADVLHVRDSEQINATEACLVELYKNTTGDKNQWIGVRAYANHDGNVDSTGPYYCFVADVRYDASNHTLGGATGFRSEVNPNDTGDTITDWRAFHATTPTGLGDITNSYGLYVEDQGTTVASTLVHGVHVAAQSGTTALGVYVDDSVELTGTLVIGENADHTVAPVAGKGLLWVRADTPNVLVFTNDLGTDTVLNSGTSPWTKTGTAIHPATGTDDVVIGATATAGAERLRVRGDVLVDNNGKVGIGASPGGDAWLDILPSADVPTIITNYGVQSRLNKTGTNASAAYYAYEAAIIHDTGNGTLNTWRGLHISSPSGTAAGTTISNVYGVYISSLAAGPAASATTYGIYQAGTGELNYFAGRCGIAIAPAADVVLKLDDTEDSGTDYGVQVNLTKGGTSAKTHYGFYSDIDQLGSGTGTYRNFFGDLAVTVSSTVASHVGVDIAVLLNFGTAGITDTVGFRYRATDSAGSLSNVRGLDVAVASGTCVNGYGVYIGSMNGTSNSWGIYQTDSDDDNYFAGRVGIGAVPGASAALEVTSTSGALVVPRMTNSEVGSLTARNGMIVYDTTNNQFLFREDGAWVTGSGLK